MRERGRRCARVASTSHRPHTCFLVRDADRLAGFHARKYHRTLATFQKTALANANIRTLTFRASHACCTSGSYMEQGNRYDLRGLRFLHRCSAPTSDNYIIPAPKNSIMREMVTLNIFALQIFLVIQQIIACFIVRRASHSRSSYPNGVIAVVFVGGHLVGICLQQVFLAFMVCLHFVLL